MILEKKEGIFMARKLTEHGKEYKRQWTDNYIKSKCTQLRIVFNNEKDYDLIAMVFSQENKTEYIKDLIREDIKKRASK